MTQDPTRAEMLEFLLPIAHADEGDEGAVLDAEVAIFYFAADYHSGQASNLYEALCLSPFKPGVNDSIENEDNLVRMLYEELEQKFNPCLQTRGEDLQNKLEKRR